MIEPKIVNLTLPVKSKSRNLRLKQKMQTFSFQNMRLKPKQRDNSCVFAIHSLKPKLLCSKIENAIRPYWNRNWKSLNGVELRRKLKKKLDSLLIIDSSLTTKKIEPQSNSIEWTHRSKRSSYWKEWAQKWYNLAKSTEIFEFHNWPYIENSPFICNWQMDNNYTYFNFKLALQKQKGRKLKPIIISDD